MIDSNNSNSSRDSATPAIERLNNSFEISSTQEIIQELKNGRMVILVDDEERENEGDLVIASDFVTPQAINFMAKYGRGLVCLTLTPTRCQQLNLDLMVKKQKNGTQYGTNFTVSIEARQGVTTGISAYDRALTIQVATQPNVNFDDIVQPGHIFPLRAQEGGVLIRAGHTEAGCDLASLAGLSPYAVICEIMNDDGTMARLPDLKIFAQEHNLKIGTIADLIQYRLQNETMIEQLARTKLKTPYGEWELFLYRDKVAKQMHCALKKGETTAQPTLVRVHEPLSILDLLSEKTKHSWPLLKALAYCENQYQTQQQNSVVVLLNCQQDASQLEEMIEILNVETKTDSKHVLLDAIGSNLSLENSNQSHATGITSSGYTSQNLRIYGIGAQILHDLGVRKMYLMSKPLKIPSMAAYGLEVEEYITEILL